MVVGTIGMWPELKKSENLIAEILTRPKYQGVVIKKSKSIDFKTVAILGDVYTVEFPKAHSSSAVAEDKMLSANETDYMYEILITRTFSELNAGVYGSKLEPALSKIAAMATAKKPAKVLFVGVGRGNEPIEAKQKFGDKIDIYSINKKAGEFYDTAGFLKSGAIYVEERKEALDLFRKVKSKVTILDLNIEEELPFDFEFDAIVFGSDVTYYLNDSIGTVNRMLSKYCKQDGEVFVSFTPVHARFEGMGEQFIMLEYFYRLADINNNLSVIVDGTRHTSLHIKKKGLFLLPLRLSTKEGDFYPDDQGRYELIYEKDPTNNPHYLSTSSAVWFSRFTFIRTARN